MQLKDQILSAFMAVIIITGLSLAVYWTVSSEEHQQQYLDFQWKYASGDMVILQTGEKYIITHRHPFKPGYYYGRFFGNTISYAVHQDFILKHVEEKR